MTSDVPDRKSPGGIEERRHDVTPSEFEFDRFYKPLPTTTSIRLLELLPSEPGTISCSMITLDLEDKPTFDALSYTWGDPITIHEKPESKSAHQHLRDLLSEADKLGDTVLVDSRFLSYYKQRPNVPFENVNWDTTKRKTIKCNGVDLPVSKNLFDVLTELYRRVYRKDGGRSEDSFQPLVGICKAKYTWIDAICINQDDIEERNAQVGSMSRIYGEAQLVLGWLGQEDFFSELAIATFETIISKISADPNWHESFKGDIREWPEIEEVQWVAVFAFLQRLWFRRAWILQEIVMANGLILLCGATSIIWDFLQLAIYVLSATKLDRSLINLASRFINYGPSSGFVRLPTKCGVRFAFVPWHIQVHQPLAFKVDPRLSYKFILEIRSIRSMLGKRVMYLSSEATGTNPIFTGGKGDLLKEALNILTTPKTFWCTQRPEPTPFTFYTLLKAFRGYQATDPRDNIFALLSIARDSCKLPKFHPLASADYHRTTRELYTEIAQFLLRESNNLQLLSEVQDISSTLIQGLPSWVPDFSVSRGPKPFSDNLHFSAWGNLAPPDLEFKPKDRLILTGIFVDTVAAVALSEGSYFTQTGKIALRTPTWYLNKMPRVVPVHFPFEKKPRARGFLPLDRFEIDGRTRGDIERDVIATSRAEAYWRTLIGDSCGDTTPAPVKYGFAFSDWVALSVKDSVKQSILLKYLDMDVTKTEYQQQHQGITTEPDISVDQILAQVLEAGELGSFYTLEEWCQLANAMTKGTLALLTQGDNNTTLRLRAFDLELGGMRFIPDADRIKQLLSYKSEMGFEENQGRVVILQDNDRRSTDEITRGAFFEARIGEVKEGRRFFRSKHSYLGMGPASVYVEDEIWLLQGATVPFILRRQEDGIYHIIGEAYVHGIMRGEAAEGKENQCQRITIG